MESRGVEPIASVDSILKEREFFSVLRKNTLRANDGDILETTSIGNIT